MKINIILANLLILLVLAVPVFVFAQDDGLVPCQKNCGFADLMKLVNNIVEFILFKMVLPISAIMFAYAGFLLLFSGGEASKRTKAKSIFVNVGLGLVFALAAWLIVKTVFVILGYKGASWIGF